MSAIQVDSATAQSGSWRSPDGAQRNPGPARRLFPDFAALHPGYDVGQRHGDKRLVRRSSTNEGGSDEAILLFVAIAPDAIADCWHLQLRHL